MNVSDAVRTFLQNERPYPLLQWYLQYGAALETQINVAVGKGRPVTGQKQAFTDGINKWWSIRIPKGAMDQPEFKDYELTWPLELHAEGIGTTGWHWRERRSVAFGFDFDAIFGHAKNEKNSTPEQIDLVREAAIKLPYVSAFRSSGGSGLHLWLRLDGVLETSNHTEHAAVARCLLEKMSADAGFNFASHLDVCGSNMWIWHRKATEENHGYELLKLGSALRVNEVPSHWKEHLVAIKSSHLMVNMPGANASEIDWYEALSRTHRKVPLEQEHRQHINELASLGFAANWVQDHDLLQTHTAGLKRLHGKLKLKGHFETVSLGTNPGEANCFMFPRTNGGWRVYRFPPGQPVEEAATWRKGTSGTCCDFNLSADLDAEASMNGGIEKEHGRYPLTTAAEVMASLAAALPKHAAAGRSRRGSAGVKRRIPSRKLKG